MTTPVRRTAARLTAAVVLLVGVAGCSVSRGGEVTIDATAAEVAGSDATTADAPTERDDVARRAGGAGDDATDGVGTDTGGRAPDGDATTGTYRPPEDVTAAAAAAAAALPTGIVPERIRIPVLGVDAPTVDLGYESATAIEVPDRAADAGWFTPSRLPGEIGPSVIAGHVDLDGGPAVFHRLRELEAGDEVFVTGVDGDSRTFEVTGQGQYPKDELPPEVFGFGDAVPELRLITCGGVFDAQEGHYRDNVVVYTQLVED